MQERSWSTARVRFFKLDYDEVMQRLREYARKMLSKKAKTVILIGSLARGDYTAFSDADIIIVHDSSRGNPVERIIDFIDPTLPVDVEPRVYTLRELIEMSRENRKIVKEIIEHGIVLAGDGKVLETLRQYYDGSNR